MAKTALDLLREKTRGRTILNAPMSKFTAMGVGGPADILIYPADKEDLAEIVAFASNRNIPRFILGKGSNLIVRDAGMRGVVICLSEGFNTLEIKEASSDRLFIYAGAGISIRRFSRWTVDQGVSGFEAVSGIPASMGGAIAMNAGAWNFNMGDKVLALEIMDSTGETMTYKRGMLKFGYRRLDISPEAIIVGALLEGAPSTPEQVKSAVKHFQTKRRESQPLSQQSAGCAFKNPPGKSAGQLIDECGLKGVKVGDAEVSGIHANFIINSGTASASEIVALMGMIQERVYTKFKVKLEPEIKIVGNWEKDKLRIKE